MKALWGIKKQGGMRYNISSQHTVVILFPPLQVMIFDKIFCLKTLYFWVDFRRERKGGQGGITLNESIPFLKRKRYIS